MYRVSGKKVTLLNINVPLISDERVISREYVYQRCKSVVTEYLISIYKICTSIQI